MKLLLSFSIVVFLLLTSYRVMAEEMESPNYRLESGSVEMSNDEERKVAPEQGTTEAIQTILTPEQLNQFQQQEFIILNNDSANQLSFTISNSTLEFGGLTDKPIQEKKITFTSNSTPGLSTNVFLRQESFFKTPNNDQIPNTACEMTGSPCTSTIARKWTDHSVLGLGYKITGQAKPTDFIDDSYYRSMVKPLLNQMIASSDRESNSGSLIFKLNTPREVAESSSETTVSLYIIPQQ